MLIRDMIKMNAEKQSTELEKAEKRNQALSAQARTSDEPAHSDCMYYCSDGGGERCDALKYLYCRIGQCSFEKKKETEEDAEEKN